MQGNLSQISSFTPQRWIRGPVFDLFFFIPFWVVGLQALFQHTLISSLGLAFFGVWIFYLFSRFPHFVAGFTALYVHRDRLKTSVLFFYVIPLLILAVFSLPVIFPSLQYSWVRYALYFVFAAWGLRHIGRQNLGLLRIYRTRQSAAALPFEVLWESLIFDAIFIQGMTLVYAPNLVVPVGAGIAAMTAGYFLYRTYAWKVRGHDWGWNANLFLLVAVLTTVVWPYYLSLPHRLYYYFFAYSMPHSVAYIGIVYLTSIEKRVASPKRFSTHKLSLFYLALLVVSLLATAAATPHFRDNLARYDMLFMGVFVTHYYFDSWIWRKRFYLLEDVFPRAAPVAA